MTWTGQTSQSPHLFQEVPRTSSLAGWLILIRYLLTVFTLLNVVGGSIGASLMGLSSNGGGRVITPWLQTALKVVVMAATLCSGIRVVRDDWPAGD